MSNELPENERKAISILSDLPEDRAYSLVEHFRQEYERHEKEFDKSINRLASIERVLESDVAPRVFPDTRENLLNIREFLIGELAHDSEVFIRDRDTYFPMMRAYVAVFGDKKGPSGGGDGEI